MAQCPHAEHRRDAEEREEALPPVAGDEGAGAVSRAWILAAAMLRLRRVTIKGHVAT